MIGTMLLAALFGCVVGIAIKCSMNLKQFSGQVGFYYTEETVTRRQLESFLKNASDDEIQNIEAIVLFREKSDIAITNKTLNRTAAGKKIEAAGNLQLIAPGKLLIGSDVPCNDSTGCVISRETAETLFGDFNILGEMVSIGEKDYIIRGILDLNSPLCIVQGDEDASYSGIRIDAPKLSLSAAQQTLTGLLPENSGWISEGNLYYGIGRAFSLLPAWKFSDDYIPTAWSDFSFWTELFRQKSDLFFTLLEKPLHIADSIMLKNFIGMTAASLVLVLSIIISSLLKKLLKK